jgi:hypothetical protein
MSETELGIGPELSDRITELLEKESDRGVILILGAYLEEALMGVIGGTCVSDELAREEWPSCSNSWRRPWQKLMKLTRVSGPATPEKLRHTCGFHRKNRCIRWRLGAVCGL